MRPRSTAINLLLASALTGGSAFVATSAHAQPVVQPLPPPAAGDLNAALRRLASNPRDMDALLAAGFASLALHDIEAAIGFFGRAQDLQPSNARVKVGLATAYVRSERPIEALRLYAEAEQAGASSLSVAGDRGLAYDLVGDNSAAQEQYSRALSGADGDEVRRRLALSQAIQGNRQGFEQTLLPLLERRDLAAYRTRAFGLAVLGEEKEAVDITQAVMPPDMAARMVPYLAYMRRLTPSQQAAAANLGIFPRAAQIGRDDPRIAAYTGRSATVRAADTALAPAGAPLGAAASPTPREDSGSQRRRPGRATSRVAERAAQADAGRDASPPPPVQVAMVQPVSSGTTSAELPPVGAATPPPVAIARVAEPVVQTTPPPPPPPPSPPPPPPPPPPPAVETPTPQPGFDLARVGSQPAAQAAAPAVAAPPTSVADAFAGFAVPPADSAVARNPSAVDITAIRPPREVERRPEATPPPPPPPPPPPVHPSRHWVQIATGRDRAALRFDWRRFAREAPAVLGKLEPHVTRWGQANRLLAGPYDSPRAAREAIAALEKAGVDSFIFTSDAGQEIERLR